MFKKRVADHAQLPRSCAHTALQKANVHVGLIDRDRAIKAAFHANDRRGNPP